MKTSRCPETTTGWHLGLRLYYFIVGLVIGLACGIWLAEGRCHAAPPEHLSLKVTLPVLTAGAVLDLGSTEWALAQGPRAYEANPLGATLTKRLALKTVGVAGEAWIISKLKPKWQRRVLIGLTVVNVGATGWNIRQGLKVRKAAAHSR